MRTKASPSLACKLVAHAAIGAVVGITLALWLLTGEPGIHRMMVYAAAPVATSVAFGGAIASLFTVGSGLSGFVMLAFDGDL